MPLATSFVPALYLPYTRLAPTRFLTITKPASPLCPPKTRSQISQPIPLPPPLPQTTNPSMQQSTHPTSFGNEATFRLSPDPSAPAALIFGWFASQPRHLAKYATIYESMHYSVLHNTIPFRVLASFSPDIIASYVLSVLRILHSNYKSARSEVSNGGVVLMFMSTAGALCAWQVDQILAGKCTHLYRPGDEVVVAWLQPRVCGAVFDSAMCAIKPWMFSGAVNEGLRVPLWLRWFVKLVIALILRIHHMFSRHPLPDQFWEEVKTADFGCDELYLYSSKDRLIHVESLDELVAERKTKGKRDVASFRVDDAEHVSIFRRHVKSYVAEITAVSARGVDAYRTSVGLGPWVVRS